MNEDGPFIVCDSVIAEIYSYPPMSDQISEPSLANWYQVPLM